MYPLRNLMWSENVLIADADYIDKVAFNLTVNFERMLERRIPPADMAKWVECVALDGGLRKGDNEIQVLLVHSKGKKKLDNFLPSSFSDDLDGKAFKGEIGEFLFSSLPVESDLVSAESLFCDSLMHLCNEKRVKRIMAVPDEEDYYEGVRKVLRGTDMADTQATVFTMEPKQGGNFRQEILGYSIMSALGISGNEFSSKQTGPFDYDGTIKY